MNNSFHQINLFIPSLSSLLEGILTNKMANSILKSHFFRKQNSLDFVWPHFRNSNVGLPYRRSPHFPILLRPPHLHLLSHSLSIHHSFLLPSPHISSLIRRRLPSLVSPMSSSLNSSQNKDAHSTAAPKTVRATIKGRVQGVFYRNWTIDNAKELGLKGWVRNRRDGSVEALFSGSPENIQEMEQRCRRGPPDAMVTGLQVVPSTDDPGTGFVRKPTV